MSDAIQSAPRETARHWNSLASLSSNFTDEHRLSNVECVKYRSSRYLDGKWKVRSPESDTYKRLNARYFSGGFMGDLIFNGGNMT